MVDGLAAQPAALRYNGELLVRVLGGKQPESMLTDTSSPSGVDKPFDRLDLHI